MKYKTIYNHLYNLGYHGMAKNHGAGLVGHFCNKFQFKRVLDVGCSNGLAVNAFIDHGRTAYGIDVSSVAIKMAMRKYKIANCIEGNVLDIPFKDRWFDAVFTCDVLEHLVPGDIKKGISEIIRCANTYLFIKVCDQLE